MDRVAMRVKLDGYKHASNCCKHMKILLWSSEDTVEYIPTVSGANATSQ